MESVTFFLPSNQPSENLRVEDAWVYVPGGSPKTKKCVVYKPMGGLPTISVDFYTHHGG